MTFIKQANLFNTSIVLLALGLLNGCASHEFKSESVDDAQHRWMQSIVAYKSTIGPPVNDDQSLGQSSLVISEEMRTIVLEKFSHQRKHKAIESLAHWLTSKEGHNMRYDLSANLFPIDSFAQKRGNCLSFTILLVSLAKVLDIDLEYNDVDLPDIWGLEDDQQGLVLFRHMNAVRRTPYRTQIFDLAIDEYDYGFPQKEISEDKAVASLYSNIATQKIQAHDYTSALHYIKYAISLHPQNPDFWVNLGVIYKKDGKINNAERSFLHALNLSDADSLAASNLENLYRQQKQTAKAEYFSKLAAKAKQKNPYVHYKIASEQLDKKRYRSARRSISRAKKLHNQDPRFYVLSSIIEQYNNDFVSAIEDIQTAYTLTVSNDDRRNYSKKARLLAIKANNNKTHTFSDSLLDTTNGE